MKITVKGYKSISSPISIDVNGLTVLSGANSSGKSSFMQPFLLMKQTIESNFDTGAILLDGANAKLTDSSEALSRTGKRNGQTFSVTLENSKSSSSITFKRHPDYGLVAESVSSRTLDLPQGVVLRRGTKSDDIRKQLPKKYNDQFLKFLEKKSTDMEWQVVKEKCFLRAEIAPKKIGEQSLIRIGFNPSSSMENFVKNIIHVPGLRGNPERSYRLADSGDLYLGSFEPYVASIVNKWKNDPKQKIKFYQLVDDLKVLGLASHISTERINDTRVEVRVSRYKGAPDGDSVNLADVGFGVSQTLPVLVALLIATEKQYVYIEQPELHLHPRAQHKMASIIARAVSNGVKVIIETHSSILIRGIQTLVAKGKIPREKISLEWFNQDPVSGKSLVFTSKLDENGAFGEWPADFDETSLMADSEYLDAVEESINGKGQV
ncbi:AAA family ATPase [Burkholderia cenocepacia]|uniref:AAA family ATPase n=1 Tax=Burkholderia cenocepacia TaxID=95486 RepID=UPI001904A9B7|nr:AAA family ATPase [Burkholderia cenocepacia]MBJ9691798.1 AAA family ATPase [Burkholderia cenocepacia]MBN3530062.1 AAA family ATPase [Burkholderia cenocepacia]MBO1856079.1 AAA family ATPase [Burkholderia cenocepacia]MBR7907567.1 AAA family ATPase [Burkholderia cenocepacia]MBR8023450.1 AAA family ATPase [Burkholderia cenocepacia]